MRREIARQKHLKKLTIDDETDATVLGLFDTFLHAIDKVGSASANVGTKDVRAIALVVDTNCHTGLGIRKQLVVSKDVTCQTTDGWQEDLEVRSGDELGVHPSSVLTKMIKRNGYVNYIHIKKATR